MAIAFVWCSRYCWWSKSLFSKFLSNMLVSKCVSDPSCVWFLFSSAFFLSYCFCRWHTAPWQPEHQRLPWAPTPAKSFSGSLWTGDCITCDHLWSRTTICNNVLSEEKGKIRDFFTCFKIAVFSIIWKKLLLFFLSAFLLKVLHAAKQYFLP